MWKEYFTLLPVLVPVNGVRILACRSLCFLGVIRLDLEQMKSGIENLSEQLESLKKTVPGVEGQCIPLIL